MQVNTNHLIAFIYGLHLFNVGVLCIAFWSCKLRKQTVFALFTAGMSVLQVYALLWGLVTGTAIAEFSW